jgi:hypothetical protein
MQPSEDRKLEEQVEGTPILWRNEGNDLSPEGETLPPTKPPKPGQGSHPTNPLPEGVDVEAPEPVANEDTGAILALLADFAQRGYTAIVKRQTLMLVKVSPPVARYDSWSTQMWVKTSGDEAMQYIVGYGWDRNQSMRRALSNRYGKLVLQ